MKAKKTAASKPARTVISRTDLMARLTGSRSARGGRRAANNDARTEANTTLPGELAYLLSLPVDVQGADVAAVKDDKSHAEGPFLVASVMTRYPLDKNGVKHQANYVNDLPTDAPSSWVVGGKATGEAQPYVVTLDGTLTGAPEVTGVKVVHPDGSRYGAPTYVKLEALRDARYQGAVFAPSFLKTALDVVGDVLDGWIAAHPERAAEANADA